MQNREDGKTRNLLKKILVIPGFAGSAFARIAVTGPFINVCTAAVVTGFIVFSAAYMTARLQKGPRYKVDLRKTFVSMPGPDGLRYPWISRSLSARLRRLGRRHGPMNIFDRETAKRVAASLARSPWVEKVVEVRPEYPSSIQWKVQYRLPAAVVRIGSKNILVDSTGRRLPDVRFQGGARRHGLYTLAGLPRGTAVPRVGERFKHPGVISGLRSIIGAEAVNRVLGSRGGGVKYIDVSAGGRKDRSEVNFVTRKGALVEWGRPAGGNLLALNAPEKKIANLEKVLIKDGTLKKGWTYRLWAPVVAAQPPDTEVRHE